MILRLEQYLARVAGGTGAIPESPETNTEAYLAILAGENRQAPEPITRLDMYLCNLIGGNYPIPTPNTRIEQYLAKACGLEIEVPTPITREEQLWYAIANPSWQLTTLTGALPLSFKSKGEVLTDYKLYGTSEGAGAQTENLFNKDAKDSNNGYVYHSQLNSDGSLAAYSSTNVSEYIAITPGENYIFSYGGTYNSVFAGIYDEQKNFIRSIKYSNNKTLSFSANTGEYFLRMSYANRWPEQVAVYEGETFITPIPLYGYKLPMIVTSEEESTTTPIYIGDTKLGAEEYVDYEEQKIYKLSADYYLQPTDPPVPLPELSTYSGENTLSCSEELGEVSITGYIKEAGNG